MSPRVSTATTTLEVSWTKACKPAALRAAGTSVEQRNRVLRNTYWLLALSLVPTVLGAWIGVTTGCMAQMGAGMSTSCSSSARSA